VIAVFAWTVAQSDSGATPDPRLKYVARSFRGMLQQQRLSASDLNILKPRVPAFLRAIGRMNRDSVMLLAGTDIAGARIPGFSLHDELAMLVTAGLTPLQAIQTATINPATILKQTKDRGTVETGRLADLVLLEKNPLSDIRNTTQISAVILRGRLFARAALDSLLSSGQRLANDQ
jgi:imidazolonepropionase-like amidohydrolase